MKKLLALLALIPALAFSAVTITHPSGNVDVWAAGSTVTISGSFGGTPTGGTLNLSAVTLTLGAITPTSVNGLTITTSTGTLTIANGKTLTASNTLTFAGTDGSTLNVGTGGTLGTGAYAAAFNPAIPGPIGGTTPSTVSATTVTLTAVVPYITAVAADLGLSTDLLRVGLAGQTYNQYNFSAEEGGSVVAGTGSTSGTANTRVISTGATAASASAYYSASSLWSTNPGAISAGGSWNWNRVAVFSHRFSANAAVGGLSTNGLFRMVIGRSNGAGALDGAGIGYGVIYASATTGSIVGYAHNGSSLTTSGALATVDLSTSAFVHQVVGISDGAGNVYFWVDGIYAGTMAGGPTAASSANRYIVAEILNNADAINNSMIISACRVWVKQ